MHPRDPDPLHDCCALLPLTPACVTDLPARLALYGRCSRTGYSLSPGWKIVAHQLFEPYIVICAPGSEHSLANPVVLAESLWSPVTEIHSKRLKLQVGEGIIHKIWESFCFSPSRHVSCSVRFNRIVWGRRKGSRHQKGDVTPSSERPILSRALGDGWGSGKPAGLKRRQSGSAMAGMASRLSTAQSAAPPTRKSRDVWAGHLHQGVPTQPHH